MLRLHAPTAHGAVLAEPAFTVIPARIEANRRLLEINSIPIGGEILSKFRAAARREVLAAAASYSGSSPERADGPLLLAGHQPELPHPGVWAKHFALNGLAKKVRGTPLNLIVDNDTIKHPSIRVPIVGPDARDVSVESVPFDRMSGKPAYEDHVVSDPEVWTSFPRRVDEIARNWGYRPLLLDCRETFEEKPAKLGTAFTHLRRQFEARWGCRNLELPVSLLSQTAAFGQFAGHIIGDLARFREVYNASLRDYRQRNGIENANHPAPDLEVGEAPFWVRSGKTGRREKAAGTCDVRSLRPRALTLTLFARLCLGDFFIHGIGGGKYDEVTDAIIRDYFDVQPPAYQVVSATLHLPLRGFAATEANQRKAERLVRDLHWNPQRHIAGEAMSDAHVLRLVADRINSAANEPPTRDHSARKKWFREIQELNEQLRPRVATEAEKAARDLEKIEAEVRANEVLHRRDYAWVLFPEETLRPFLQRFLDL